MIKKSVIVIIILCTISVIVAALCPIFLDHEKIVKSRISALATDYYENYFYLNLTNPDDANLEKYHTYGLAPVALRNLFLYDDQKNISHRDYLTKYCDENSTFIKFYMDPPYGPNDYRYDITYACNF